MHIMDFCGYEDENLTFFVSALGRPKAGLQKKWKFAFGAQKVISENEISFQRHFITFTKTSLEQIFDLWFKDFQKKSFYIFSNHFFKNPNRLKADWKNQH